MSDLLPPFWSMLIEQEASRQLSRADVDLLRTKMLLLPLVLQRHVIRATFQDGQLTLVFSASLLRR